MRGTSEEIRIQCLWQLVRIYMCTPVEYNKPGISPKARQEIRTRKNRVGYRAVWGRAILN